MDFGNRFACLFADNTACGLIEISLPGADVDVRDLAPFFDFDDPGLFLVGCVGMICARKLPAPTAKLIALSVAARADDVSPRRQPIDTINASVVRYECLNIPKVTSSEERRA